MGQSTLQPSYLTLLPYSPPLSLPSSLLLSPPLSSLLHSLLPSPTPPLSPLHPLHLPQVLKQNEQMLTILAMVLTLCPQVLPTSLDNFHLFPNVTLLLSSHSPLLSLLSFPLPSSPPPSLFSSLLSSLLSSLHSPSPPCPAC